MKAITGMATALLFLFVTFPSHAVEVSFMKVKPGNSQEKMGSAIKDSAWLSWNKGRVQETTGRFILDGAQSGKISQEALGSGIAASAHLDWELMGKQEQLGAAIVNIAQIGVNRSMQGRLGRSIASSTVIDEAGEKQVSMGNEIQNQARINWVMGMMSKVAYANLEGDTSQEISGSMIAMLRDSRAFEHERNFRLAMVLLEKETGQAMTQIFEDSGTGGSVLSAQFTRGGLGGFAEYGFFSIAAFLYVGWVFSTFLTSLGYPHEAKEVPYKLPEAA